jgi:hypothetical protein
MEKYKVIYKGYFGGFVFWRESDKLNFIQKGIEFIFKIMKKLFKYLPNNRIYSAHCGMIVQKI